MTGDATTVVTLLAAGRKANQLYPATHPAFSEAMDALVAAVEQATSTGPFQLNLHQGRLYNDDAPLPLDAPGVPAVQEAFESRSIESATFQPGLTRDETIGFVQVLGLRPSPSLDVEKELADRGVERVTIAYLLDEDSDEREERERLREQDRALYNRLVGVLRALSARVADRGAPDLMGASELVGSIMGRLLDDQAAVLGLATIKGQTETNLFHSINVMIYSVALGATLGLPEQGLASLGVSSLMHDIGKAAFDHSDPDQLDAMRTAHPAVGADILARLPGDDQAPMLVAYEHHMLADGSGYPDRPADYVTHPYSRMVAIADRYANLVDPATGAEPLTPDHAVMQLLQEAGRTLDPIFTRMFAKAMGVFPVGCMVRLDDQSVGVVARAGTDLLTPIVRVLYDPSGLPFEDPKDIDLGVEDVRIIEVVAPECLNVAVSEHI